MITNPNIISGIHTERIPNGRMGSTWFSQLTLISILGYVAFIPPGPYPIYLNDSLKLDILCAYACVTLCILQCKTIINSFPRNTIVLYVFFILAIMVSAIFSVEPKYSVKSAIVIFGYAGIALFSPKLMYPHTKLIKNVVFIIAILVSLYTQYDSRKIGSSSRYTLYSGVDISFSDYDAYRLDPNMTAIGLALSLLIFLSEMMYVIKNIRHHYLLASAIIVAYLLVFDSILIYESRTATVSFLGSVFISSLLFLYRNKLRNFNISYVILGVFLIATIVGVGIYSYSNFDVISTHIESIIFRLSNDENGDISSSNGRVQLARSALEIGTQDLKHLLVGNGFFTLNPHNEILQYFSSAGVLGLGAVSLLVSSVYTNFCRDRFSIGYRFQQETLFVFFMLSIQTYGHTKTFWIPLQFIIINFYSIRDKPH